MQLHVQITIVCISAIVIVLHTNLHSSVRTIAECDIRYGVYCRRLYTTVVYVGICASLMQMQVV